MDRSRVLFIESHETRGLKNIYMQTTRQKLKGEEEGERVL